MKYSDFDKLVEDFSEASHNFHKRRENGGLHEEDREVYRIAKVALKQAYDRIYKAAFAEGKKMILSQF